MNKIGFYGTLLLLIFAFTNTACSQNRGDKMAESIYDFTVKDIDNNEVELSKYKDKVVLIVNVASKCGFTPQYEGLQKLYEQYKDQGLVILGFPCNQFGSQEPGTNKEIKEFCTANFGVNFPMFDKIDVNGDNAHPLYKYLKDKAPGSLNTKAIKWNFTKFLVNKDGEVLERYGSATSPEQLEKDVKGLL
jgi:glutathione peroxidase